MKTPSIAPRSARGFTLIELMVVIAIMAMLAAFTLMGFRYANNAAKRNLTMSFKTAIEGGLERYFTDNGEYPEPDDSIQMAEFNGKNYPTGGALMLYQALSGDGSDEIKTAAGGTKPSDGQWTTAEVGEMKMNEMPRELWKRTSNGYIVVDGYGHPFQYTKGPVATRPGAAPAASVSINNTYDLWSFGEDESNTQRVDLNTKRGEQSAKWIKNW